MQVSSCALDRRRSRERGSALLIVFVFAAFVAIMLYKEMPVAIFEARRQKEQLLVDRGNEYKRAIKLFVVRNRTFPTSLAQLDNFGNVRYIRHRFKDPMTGQDEWRLIHAMGPGFVLTDSKVTPLKKPTDTNSFGATSAGTDTAAAAPQNIRGLASSTAATPAQTNQAYAPPTPNPVAFVTPGQPVVYHLYPSQQSAETRNRPAAPASAFPEQQQPGTESNNGQPSEDGEALTAGMQTPGQRPPALAQSGVQTNNAAANTAGDDPNVENPNSPNPNPANAGNQEQPLQAPPAGSTGATPGMAAVQNMLRREGPVPAASSKNNTLGSGRDCRSRK